MRHQDQGAELRSGEHYRAIKPLGEHADSSGKSPSRVFEEIRMHTSTKAQGLVEYGLIIALVAILAIAAIVVFGPAVAGLLSRLGGSV